LDPLCRAAGDNPITSKAWAKSVPDRSSPRSPFAVFGFRTGAPERIASIGLDLSKEVIRS
jgi:hypothetical protein